jgi:hypothetical protein
VAGASGNYLHENFKLFLRLGRLYLCPSIFRRLITMLQLSLLALVCIIFACHVDADMASNKEFTSELTSAHQSRKLQIPLPAHTGLSKSCSNSLCSMMETGLSCKAMGLGFKKVYFALFFKVLQYFECVTNLIIISFFIV